MNHKSGILTLFRRVATQMSCDGYMSKVKPCPRCTGRGVLRQRMTLLDSYNRAVGMSFGFVCTRCGWYYAKRRDGLTRMVHEDRDRIYLKTA